MNRDYKVVSICMTAEQIKEVTEKAKELNQSRSAYIRDCIFGENESE